MLDFKFMREWPPWLRWIVVLPAGWAGTVLAILGANIVIFLVPQDAHVLRSVLGYLRSSIADALFVLCGAAAAPHSKVAAGVVLGVIRVGTYLLLLAWASSQIDFTPIVRQSAFMHVALLLLAAVAANGIILAALRKGMLTLPTKG